MTEKAIEKWFEIVAPAGDIHSLAAAVMAGADAVYFGFRDFNARRRAANFDDETILKAITFLRSKGISSYITLNTVIQEEELPELERKLYLLVQCPPDAIIFQDLAVAELARCILPGVALHVSTQAGICNRAGLEVARRIGASRVVVARELSATELADLAKDAPVELEVFVFGAMCSSVSGYCYASRQETGRSGNRGACAQVCRLAFGGHRPFSMKDLDLMAETSALVRLGITVFKIEGRMKGADYVYESVSVLRMIREGAGSAAAVQEARQRLSGMLLRERGTGYFHFPVGSLYTEKKNHIHSDVGTVSWIQGNRLGLAAFNPARLRLGDRLKINGQGAVIIEVRGDVITLSRSLPARPGDPVGLFPNRDRIKGLSTMVKEIRKTVVPTPVHIRVEIEATRLMAAVYHGDGRLLAQTTWDIDTQLAERSGITAELLMGKLAAPAYSIKSIQVNPNKFLIRHSVIKELKRWINQAIAEVRPLNYSSLIIEYPDFSYSQPVDGSRVLPPITYDKQARIHFALTQEETPSHEQAGLGILLPPSHETDEAQVQAHEHGRQMVSGKGNSGRQNSRVKAENSGCQAQAITLVVNNLGQLSEVENFPGKVLTGPFIPVLNRVCAHALKGLGVHGFLRPHESSPTSDTPHFLLRHPPEPLPSGFRAEPAGDVFQIFRSSHRGGK